jgi:hypothetical protein
MPAIPFRSSLLSGNHFEIPNFQLLPEFFFKLGVYSKGADAGATCAGSKATRTGNAMPPTADKSIDYGFE